MEPLLRQSPLAAHQWPFLGHVHVRPLLGVPLRYGARVLSGPQGYGARVLSERHGYGAHALSVDDSTDVRAG